MIPFPPLVILLALISPVHAQEFQAQLRWEVGAVNGADWETWMQVQDAVVMDSTVFVLDSRLPVLRQFDINGKFLADVGGSGGGPGEFAAPGPLEPFSDGFFACDQLQGRVTEFDRDGEGNRTIQLTYPTLFSSNLCL